MTIWLQVILFVITNAPEIIKAIRELMKLFRGDKEVARAVLRDLKDAKERPYTSQAGKAAAYAEVIERYKSQV